MTNLVSSRTGLNYPIWIGPDNKSHSFRVKVSNFKKNNFADNECFTLSVQREPELKAGRIQIKMSDVDDVKDWIKINYELLQKISIAYQRGEDTIDLISQLEKLNYTEE
jgi:hypothetical protein